MTAGLFYVGLTHQTAPLAIRENVRVDAEKLRTLLSRLAGVADGRLVLGTCERFEIYATTRHTAAAEWALMLSQWFHVPASLLAAHLRTLVDVQAARHLLRVAAGLESRIIGEAQILGQVRDAFQTALEMNALDAELSTLGRTAIRTGKRVRSETNLGSGSRSIATIALDALTTDRGNLDGLTAAVLGTGRLAEVVLGELRRRGVRDRVVIGRDVAQIEDLAHRFETEPQGMSGLRQALERADAVFVCTAAPTYVVDAALVPASRSRPLSVFDLSVPRNVDPMIRRIPMIFLTHLDDLAPNGFAAKNQAIDNPLGPVASALGSERAAAGRMIEDELDRFVGWRRDRRVAPRIAELVREVRATNSLDKAALHRRIVALRAEAMA